MYSIGGPGYHWQPVVTSMTGQPMLTIGNNWRPLVSTSVGGQWGIIVQIGHDVGGNFNIFKSGRALAISSLE